MNQTKVNNFKYPASIGTYIHDLHNAFHLLIKDIAILLQAIKIHALSQ